MEVRIKADQTLTEPITAALWRAYSGLDDTTQDTLIETMITAARLWLENHTGCSVISKSYEAEFDISDGYENWYELPFSPVVSITSVQIDDVDITYSQRGQGIVEIYPDSIIGSGTEDNIIKVEFIAGATDERATIAIYRIASDYFDARKDNPAAEISSAVLKWGTMHFVNQLSNNITI